MRLHHAIKPGVGVGLMAPSPHHSSGDDMKCVHSWCTERAWEKVGKSWEKLGKVAKSWKKLEKVGKNWEKWGKMGKSGKKWGKVGKSREKQ